MTNVVALAAIAAVAVVTLLLVSSRGRWSRAGAWLALALVARAALLQLYRAGPNVTYHHLKPEGDAAELIALGSILLTQAVAVAVGVRTATGEIRAWLARSVGAWRALA